MPYPFLGTSTRIYTQFKGGDGKTLQAEPGGLYDITPAPGTEGVTVPPADGLWGPWQDAAPAENVTEDTPAPKGRAGKNAAAAAKGE